MSEANLKIYGATADGKMLVSAEEVQAIISKELAIAGEEIEQLQKENKALESSLEEAIQHIKNLTIGYGDPKLMARCQAEDFVFKQRGTTIPNKITIHNESN